jgi:hypothetical protein
MCGGFLGGATAGFVVGVEVVRPRSEDVRGGGDVREKQVDESVFAGRDGAVGEVEATDGGCGDAEAVECGGLLAPTDEADVDVVCVGVFAVGDGDDADVDGPRAEMGDEAARAEGFVIGVRSDDDGMQGRRGPGRKRVETHKPSEFVDEGCDHNVSKVAC